MVVSLSLFGGPYIVILAKLGNGGVHGALDVGFAGGRIHQRLMIGGHDGQIVEAFGLDAGFVRCGGVVEGQGHAVRLEVLADFRVGVAGQNSGVEKIEGQFDLTIQYGKLV